VDWIGFDPIKNIFTGDPVNTMAWFAAANVPTLPAPAPAGTTQSPTISTGQPNLAIGNFSVKAYVGGSVVAGSGGVSVVSGSGQTGNTGKTLPASLTVQVLSANSSPLSGVPVSFSSTAGGGTLSVAHVTTNSQGIAATTLTLGPNA